MTATQYYKVLMDGQSAHGGALAWSLPTQNADGEWTPGTWHEVDGAIVVCNNGLHLTSAPGIQMKPGASVYLAEYDGETDTGGGDKIAVRRARLLRPVTSAELAALRIFVDGEHAVTDGVAWASGSATVRASGSATVRASGSAMVEAYGSAMVEASGSAMVEAYGSATVRASDSATVRASDSATVRAFDSATVEASGSATVEASDSATVRAFDSATVEAYDSATVEASDSATVRASGSAMVEASDSATVEAYDSATVEASDSATVRAFDSATVEVSDSATVTTTNWYTGDAITVSDSAVWIDRRHSPPRIVVGGVAYTPEEAAHGTS